MGVPVHGDLGHQDVGFSNVGVVFDGLLQQLQGLLMLLGLRLQAHGCPVEVTSQLLIIF